MVVEDVFERRRRVTHVTGSCVQDAWGSEGEGETPTFTSDLVRKSTFGFARITDGVKN